MNFVEFDDTLEPRSGDERLLLTQAHYTSSVGGPREDRGTTRVRYAPRPVGLPPDELVSECLLLFAKGKPHLSTVRLGDQLDKWLERQVPYAMSVCERLAKDDVPIQLMLTGLMVTREAKSKLWTRPTLVNAATKRLAREQSPDKAESVLRGLR